MNRIPREQKAIGILYSTTPRFSKIRYEFVTQPFSNNHIKADLHFAFKRLMHFSIFTCLLLFAFFLSTGIVLIGFFAGSKGKTKSASKKSQFIEIHAHVWKIWTPVFSCVVGASHVIQFFQSFPVYNLLYTRHEDCFRCWMWNWNTLHVRS